MSSGSNPNLIANVGSVQQKSAIVAYNKSVSRSETKSPVPQELGGSQAAQETHDSASISRAAIAALESTRVISEETVIRDDKAAASALEYTKDQIRQQTDRAVMAHGNQMSQQVLEMYGQ
jgi:hypothetical protein